MIGNQKVAFRSVIVFYFLSYGIPVIYTAWYVATGKLGFDPLGGSGWCSLKVNEKQGIFNTVFGNDMWIYLTMFLVPVIFMSLHYHLRSEVSLGGSSPGSRAVTLSSINYPCTKQGKII